MLSTLLVLTLAMRELRQWLSIVGMLPQSHCGDKEDRRIGLSSIYFFIYSLLRFHIFFKVIYIFFFFIYWSIQGAVGGWIGGGSKLLMTTFNDNLNNFTYFVCCIFCFSFIIIHYFLISLFYFFLIIKWPF